MLKKNNPTRIKTNQEQISIKLKKKAAGNFLSFAIIYYRVFFDII